MEKQFRSKLPSRFTDKVKIDASDQCWEWTAGKIQDGYGRFKWQRVLWLAHRLSYVLYNDVEIPDGLIIMHNCDNPSCVNPAHLRLGTVADNNADMIAKGRGRGLTGEAHGSAKLIEADVLQMRDLYASKKYTCEQLGKLFHIGKSQAHNIIARKQWTHI